MPDLVPFTVRFSDAALSDLRERLERTRWPAQINDSEWSYGTDLDYLRSLCDYWATRYDWRAREEAINRFDHFTTEIDGQTLHFIHQRSVHDDATPLIITHGWPGSVVEFLEIIGPLVHPLGHGGRAEDACHVVCPSLPGFGFSPAAASPGMQAYRIADLQAELMRRLGYSRYVAQGGDWGAMIGACMASQDAAACAGLHLNMVIAQPPDDVEDPRAMLDDADRRRLERADAFNQAGMGYFHIQSTCPQTLSYALADSPAGLAAWIVEKFRAWSDCGGDVESAFSRDALLDNIMLYWLSGDPGAAGRLYYEMMHSEFRPLEVDVPTGVAVFPKEMANAPRAWAERRYRLVHWEEYPEGGHFAAMEQPERLVGDIRLFIDRLRSVTGRAGRRRHRASSRSLADGR